MEINIECLPKAIFVTGIGTDVGKSWATGWLAAQLRKQGVKCITQKFIQTGNKDYSEDICVHRKVMRIQPEPRDEDHTTAPVILSYPASPHLAERLDGVIVDYSVVAESTKKLLTEYDCVLIEGAGGIAVPLRGDRLTIDYVREEGLPAIVVTNGQLGSINHTILTLEALGKAGIEVWAVIYNPYFDKDEVIANDNVRYIREWLGIHFPHTQYLRMPEKVL